MIVAATDRLILRHWLPADREPFARMNADTRVMEFVPVLLSREESGIAVGLVPVRLDSGRKSWHLVSGRRAARRTRERSRGWRSTDRPRS